MASSSFEDIWDSVKKKDFNAILNRVREAESFPIDTTNQHGEHLLHFTALNDDLKLSQELISRGAKYDTAARNGVTPLMWAAREGNISVASALLSAGANPNATDKDGYTPLHFAAHAGHEGIVKLLLNAGATVNTRDQNQRVALHRAASIGDLGIVKMLIETGNAEIDPQNRSGWTPLHCASYAGFPEVCRYLLSHGAREDVQTKDGHQPLRWGYGGSMHAHVDEEDGSIHVCGDHHDHSDEFEGDDLDRISESKPGSSFSKPITDKPVLNMGLKKSGI
eukprot:gb/GECH01013087.1/.p1 GENE.gb/GECH01013087.1/~~gb/GECH01013087.1/.p1  ORF type:complete len:279 (+),score=68.66 gb/GECH01013087.1/:1-837(+)